MAKIFVIEDDENISNLIKMALEGYGYEVSLFEDAETALGELKTQLPDLAIFDLMLPGMDGLTAIEQIRRMDTVKNIPMLILTAKDKEYDKVLGLDKGADDYMTKPFGVMELAARVRSLLRRGGRSEAKDEQQQIKIRELMIDTATRDVMVGGENIELTYKEFELLLYLIENSKRVVSREELLNHLWGYECDVETRTVDIHIGTLRKKLKETGTTYIKTLRNVGYRFVMPE
ncbi:MAG: response regulator transcription factor [Lachnospiraceae bacterium]